MNVTCVRFIIKKQARKKYMWGLVNPVQKCVYYLYKAGSRSRKAISDFFGGLTGSMMTDDYNVYSMFADGKTAERFNGKFVCRM